MFNNDIEVFEESIVGLLQNVDKYITLPEGHTWNDKLIKSCDIDYTIEYKSKKSNCLHIHILFNIEHYSKIQLNYSAIKGKIQTDLGLNNVYMYNRLVRNNGNQNILEYLGKYT